MERLKELSRMIRDYKEVFDYTCYLQTNCKKELSKLISEERENIDGVLYKKMDEKINKDLQFYRNVLQDVSYKIKKYRKEYKEMQREMAKSMC